MHVFHFVKRKCDFSFALREHRNVLNSHYFNAELNFFRGISAVVVDMFCEIPKLILSGLSSSL